MMNVPLRGRGGAKEKYNFLKKAGGGQSTFF